MLQRRLEGLQRDFAVKLIIAVIHDDEHVQIGLAIPLAPCARTIKDDAEHAIAEARP